MNANELADLIGLLESEAKTTARIDDFIKKSAATMLRQQQAEIEALKAHPVNPYQSITDTKIDPTIVSYTHPAELTDEEIADFLYAYCLDMGNVYEASEEQFIKCVRAILRKAQEK